MLFAFLASGYVHNISPSGNKVHWSSSSTTIDVYVNSSNGQSINDSAVQSIAVDSVNEWNNLSNITIRKNSTAGSGQSSLNEIYFSTDPTVFNGSGVVGITEVTYKNNSGEILEADILLNDNFTFSTDISADSYLGNVITHEMGHFLGLGHSQVAGSSMFYSLSLGQSELHPDDQAGAYSIYPTGNPNKVSLSGKIIGSNKLIEVFGTHVEAVSVTTGKVDGSAISDLDGTFKIDGLRKNDQYLLYTKPIVKVGLPTKYNTAKSNFCESGKSYRGSFFQSCGSTSEGFPQSINLNSSINVGNVTIRCGFDVPTDYMQTKGTTPPSFDLMAHVPDGIGNVFTGYFSAQEIANPLSADYFRIDFSNESWPATGDLYLELKVTNQTFNSAYKANVSVKRNSSTTIIAPKYVRESDGWLNIDTVAHIPISRADMSDNDFEIKISPESMISPSFPTGIPLTKIEYFPGDSDFEDALSLYLVTATIVKSNGDGSYSNVFSRQDQLSDNTLCPDAVNTYSLTKYTTTGNTQTTNASRSKTDKGILGCGSIDTNSDAGGSGPTGFFIGLILSLLLCDFTAKMINRLRARSLVQDRLS